MSPNEPVEKQTEHNYRKKNDLTKPCDNGSVEPFESEKTGDSIPIPPDELPPRVPVREPQRKPPILMRPKHRRAAGIF